MKHSTLRPSSLARWMNCPAVAVDSRLFDIVAVNEKTGEQTKCNADPLTHDDACTMVKRFSSHPARHVMLVPYEPAR